jgi:hypothetical protein
MPDRRFGLFEPDPGWGGLSLFEAMQESHDAEPQACCVCPDGYAHGPEWCHVCCLDHGVPRNVQACLGEPDGWEGGGHGAA